MVETLPMLEHDPRRDYRTSRILRVSAFSLFASIVLVTLLIVVVRYLWDNFLAKALNRAPYESNPILVIPAIVIIAGILGKLLWDIAEGREQRSRAR